MAESIVISSIATSPMLSPAKTRKHWCKELNKLSESHPARVSMEFQPFLGTYCVQINLCASVPVGLGLHLQSSHSLHRRRRRPLSASMICASALQGQTQTITPEAPTTIPNPPGNSQFHLPFSVVIVRSRQHFIQLLAPVTGHLPS